jgi:ABC-type lipoprotein release transport system permease subunit
MFKLIFKTAILALFRRKLRTFLAIFMIASSLWGLMVMLGIYDGMIKQMIDNAVRSDSGDITIYKKDYRSDNDIKHHIKEPETVINEIEKNPAIKSYVQRVLSDGLIATAKYSKGVKIFGIDLESEKRQAKLDSYIKEGSFDFGKRNRGVIIGATLAKKLKISIGKKVILSAQNSENEINSIALKVTGILKTNNMHIDGIAVFIPLKKAQKFLDIDGVMQISMIFEDKSKIRSFQHALKQKFKNLELFAWYELYPALMQSQAIMEQYSLISYVLIFFVAGIGIFGVVLVSVLERLREFAILQAIGTPFKMVAQIIFLESLFIGIIGFILGCILGGGTLYYFYIYGLDLSRFSDALDEFGMDAITYAVIKPSYFLTGFFAVLIAIVLSIIFPLHLLKKSKPIEVIND